MLGALAGDVIGSVYEHRSPRTEDFRLFTPHSRPTDDSVLTLATAEALLGNRDYALAYLEWGRAYPHAGYGGSFRKWLQSERPQPYGSWGNGSAMRVSPLGHAFASLPEVMEEARRSAEVTHDHPEGIQGAQAVAGAVFLARQGTAREDLRSWLADTFGYPMDRTVEGIRPGYRFEVSCQRSVPEALICFLDSRDWEDAVRKAVSLRLGEALLLLVLPAALGALSGAPRAGGGEGPHGAAAGATGGRPGACRPQGASGLSTMRRQGDAEHPLPLRASARGHGASSASAAPLVHPLWMGGVPHVGVDNGPSRLLGARLARRT